MENGALAPKELQKSKCSIFHNIFKYMIFQRCEKALLWSKGLKAEFPAPQELFKNPFLTNEIFYQFQ